MTTTHGYTQPLDEQADIAIARLITETTGREALFEVFGRLAVLAPADLVEAVNNTLGVQP